MAQEAIRRSINTLDKQAKETGEAIESIDRHRRQIAQKLVELEGLFQASNGTVSNLGS